MKNTLITLATLATLAVSANAQLSGIATVNGISLDSTDANGVNTFTGNVNFNGQVAGTATISALAVSNFADSLTPTNSGRLSQGSTTDIATQSSSVWRLSFAANPGFSIDGISIFSTASVLGNPTFGNVTSNGVISVVEGTVDFFSNAANGDIIANGSDLIADQGNLGTGYSVGPDFSIDTTGDSLGFTYTTGSGITNISAETLEFQVQATDLNAVPEPSSTALLGLGALGLLARRKR